MSITDIVTKTLSRKLIAMFLISGLLIIAVIGYLSYNQAEKALEESSLQGLMQGGDSLTNNLITYFSEQLVSAELLSHDSSFQEQADIEKVRSDVSEYNDATSETLYDVMIIDKNGKIAKNIDN